MPTSTVIVIAVICAAFLGFALTLAWVDYTTGRIRRGTPAE